MGKDLRSVPESLAGEEERQRDEEGEARSPKEEREGRKTN